MRDVVTEAVERLDRRVREFTHPVVTVGDDSLSHLRRRVVGERHEEDVLGLDVVLVDDFCVSTGNGERLPGPRPGVDDVDALFAVDESSCCWSFGVVIGFPPRGYSRDCPRTGSSALQ